MTTYRDFNIEHNGWAYIYSHKEYDGPEDRRCGSASSIEEAKDNIDEYYFESTEYRVITRKTITKFTWIDDAVAFVQRFGGVIQPMFKNREIQFDSI
jgi:hypothetical protein